MSENNSSPADKPSDNGNESPDSKSRLFDEASREAARYKWLESEKAGHDLGKEALEDWHSNYWRSWCRERWIEHLRGERFWIELDAGDYGLLQKEFHDNLEIAEKIIDRIKLGGENLDIIQWANDENYDIETVLEVLKILDINSRRLTPPEEFIDSMEKAVEELEKVEVKSKKRILVVDDDIDTGVLLKELFEKEGLEVIVAASGEKAVEYFEKMRFQAFLIDIMLPGKHGAEVAWYLRRHGVIVPVIAISAVLDKWNEDDLYDCGFTGIMAKPFDLEALRNLAQEIKNK
ncbi:MAG: response regulator [Planctomycetota bacterium]|jgi:CheY-like chemotaxis protein